MKGEPLRRFLSFNFALIPARIAFCFFQQYVQPAFLLSVLADILCLPDADTLKGMAGLQKILQSLFIQIIKPAPIAPLAAGSILE